MAPRWLHRMQYNRKTLLFTVVYALLSVYAMAHFISSSYLGDRYIATSFDTMMQGKAARPFAYRVLMPTLTHTITDATPKSWQTAVNTRVRQWMTSERTVEIRQALPWLVETYDVRAPYARIVCTLLIYCALVGYAFMLYRLAQSVDPANEALRWFAPIFGLLAISAFSMPWQYIYDIPVLFLSAACFYLLHQQRMKAYLVCFALACLNRETSIFLLMFFMLWSHNRMPRTSFIAFAAVQMVVWLFIKIAVTQIYAGNPGQFLEFNLLRVLRLDIFERADHMRVVLVCMMFFLLTYRWNEKPVFLRTGLWVLAAMYVAYIFYGNGGEYRVFFDIMPLMVCLATHTLTGLAGFNRLAFFASDTEKPNVS
ncbi:MAG: hypothetical protein AB7L92_06380 [Alphaproteobacteria bacterium]